MFHYKSIDPIVCFSRVIAVLILTFVGCSTHQRPIHWNLANDIFLRVGCGLIVLALAVASARLVDRIDVIERRTNWWDVGEESDKPTWDDVRRMTIGSSQDDPIIYKRVCRKSSFYSTIKMIIGYLIVLSILIETLSILVNNSLLTLMFTNESRPWTALADLRLDTNLTAFLALLAAAVSIYFTYRQLQAKVKADSRQAWIDKLRAHIALFIALSDEIHCAQNGHRLKKERIKLTKCRLEIELMLNPSENDHRLLMFLGIKLAFFDVGNDEFLRVDDVKYVIEAIKPFSTKAPEKWAPLLAPIPDRYSARIEHEHAYSDLIGYTIRLAHVVLKREWERVKATR